MRLRRIHKGPRVPAVFKENAMLREKVYYLNVEIECLDREIQNRDEEIEDQYTLYLRQRQSHDALVKRIAFMEKHPKSSDKMIPHGFFGA